MIGTGKPAPTEGAAFGKALFCTRCRRRATRCATFVSVRVADSARTPVENRRGLYVTDGVESLSGQDASGFVSGPVGGFEDGHIRHEVLEAAHNDRRSRKRGMIKRATCHTYCHSFATDLLEDGYDIRTVQALLGHKGVKTTMIYPHVLNRGPSGVRGPVDGLWRGGSYADPHKTP